MTVKSVYIDPALIHGEFLALTAAVSEKPVFIDPAAVDAVTDGREGYTSVVLGSNRIVVRESAEEIVGAINEYAKYSTRW